MGLKDRATTYADRVRHSALVQTLIRWWLRLPATTRSLPAHLFRAFKNFEKHGPRQAAALSYYAVFSVFPLALLLAVGIGTILGPTVAQQQIVDGLALFLPEQTDTISLIQDSLADALNQSGSFTLLAVLGVSWSALGLFSNLTSSLDQIFQAPQGRSLWRKRLLAFVMTLILIALVITSFLTSGILRLIDALTASSVWISIGTFFLPFGLNMVIFVLLFRYVPSRLVTWDAVWPASVFGAVVLEAAKALFAWYLSTLANFQIVYGSIATVIVFLLWAFLTACIFLLSAELCSQLNLWFMAQSEPARAPIYTGRSFSELPAEVPPPA
ncbi:YihY/virulence factor BrkB family protein [bacterium]|nr:YihY/virulence factor BrkB family protein [bacterium]